MTIFVGKAYNFNDSPTITAPVSVDGVTAIALVTLAKEHSILIMTNDGNQDAFIRMYSAATGNNKEGFILYKGTTTELVLDYVRTDIEVSAIARNGTTTIYTTVM